MYFYKNLERLKFFFPVILILLFPIIILSQNDKKIDSLQKIINNKPDNINKVRAYAKLYNIYLYQDHVKAKTYAEKELNLSKKLGYKEGIGFGLYHLGVFYNNIDDIDSSRIYYENALKIFEEIDLQMPSATVIHSMAILKYSEGNYDEALNLLEKNLLLYSNNSGGDSDLATTYVLRSSIYRSQGNYKLALNAALSALNLYKKLDEPIRKADALGALASIEFSLNNFEESIAYNKEALKIYVDYNDTMYAAQALNDIGNVYYYLKKYDEALDFLHKSYNRAKKAHSQDIMATALGNIGKVYTEQGKHDKALSNLLTSLQITNESGNQFKSSEFLNDIGNVYNNLNKPNKAISYFDNSIAIANEIEARENLRFSYLNKSKSYEKLGKYQKALENYKQFSAISDSIFNSTKQQQIEELRTIYETEKKEQQIQIQEKEIELLKQKEENNNLFRILLGIGLLLALIGLYAIYQKLKRNKLEKEKVDTELAFKKKQLTTHALHLAKKNEVLESLKQKAKTFKSSENTKDGYQQLIQTINFDLKDDNNWENFSKYFQEVHKDFNSNVKHKFPDVTPNEIRLMSLLKMNLTSKEIANILNISQEGIKKARYRLRKKLGISTEDSLVELVLNL